MDQNPLPRGSFQVRDRSGEAPRIILELPGTAVAVEARYPAHPPIAMIVIDVFLCPGAGAAAWVTAVTASAGERFPLAAIAAPPRTRIIRIGQS